MSRAKCLPAWRPLGLFGALVIAGTLFGQADPIVSTGNLPPATVGVAYNVTLSVSGGTPPYTWSASGTVPPGLTVNASGSITGTPTTAGSYTFTLLVRDSNQALGSGNVIILVSVPPLAITTAPPLFSGVVGVAYAQTFLASGGSPPYTWTITSGNTGELVLDSKTGVLSGTPQTAGTFSFILQVSDTAGAKVSQNFSVVVNPPTLTITVGGSLPAGAVGTAYSQKVPVVASGGTPPYTWSLTSTAIPGLSFDATALTLSGTPTAAGNYNVAVQLRDSAGVTASRSLPLIIAPAGLTITTARQLPDGALNVSYSQQISASGGVPPYNWAATGLPGGLAINASTGLVSGTPTAAGSFAIAITVYDSSSNLTNYSDRFTMNVKLPSTPSASVSGLPATAQPAQQFPLQIALGSTFPAPITGQATLTFTPDNGPADKTVLFASGNTVANFTIPTGTLNAVPDVAPLAIQTGTASGTITITVRLQAGGVDITPIPAPAITTQVPRAAPVIKSVQVTRTASSISLAIAGFSTTREASKAVFTFQAATGQSLQPTASSITVDITSLFGNWFQSASSSDFGTVFLFTQPFSVQGDPTAVIPVSVTLTNSVGSTSSNISQ